MSSADAVAEELGLHPVVGVARSRRIVRPRHRDRDYTLRRALVIADMAGLWLALAFSMTVIGSRARSKT